MQALVCNFNNFSWEFYGIFRKHLFYRTPPATAFDFWCNVSCYVLFCKRATVKNFMKLTGEKPNIFHINIFLKNSKEHFWKASFVIFLTIKIYKYLISNKHEEFCLVNSSVIFFTCHSLVNNSPYYNKGKMSCDVLIVPFFITKWALL